jgi:hypothetical protein
MLPARHHVARTPWRACATAATRHGQRVTITRWYRVSGGAPRSVTARMTWSVSGLATLGTVNQASILPAFSILSGTRAARTFQSAGRGNLGRPIRAPRAGRGSSRSAAGRWRPSRANPCLPHGCQAVRRAAFLDGGEQIAGGHMGRCDPQRPVARQSQGEGPRCRVDPPYLTARR